MTANNTNGVSAPHASTSIIDGVDAFALRLYRRARNSGTDFEDIAFVVRNLHTVLKHLKSEAESPESLLAVGDSAVYTRQLTPIIEDCEFTLQQLNTILDKYGDHSGGNDGRVSPTKHRTRMDGNMGWTMENVEREKIKLIKNKLMKQKLNIDMFLDTIQLHNRPRSEEMVDTSGVDLESIKDKVDAIATRICSRRNSGLTQDEEELWMRFRNELEREGFSREVLRKNQVSHFKYLTRQVYQVNIERRMSSVPISGSSMSGPLQMGAPLPQFAGFLRETLLYRIQVPRWPLIQSSLLGS